MDRQDLIVRACTRIAEDGLADATRVLTELRSQQATSGRLGGGSSKAALLAAAKKVFQAACIAVLDKLQFEERDDPSALSEIVRDKVITPMRRRFVSALLTASGMPRPTMNEKAPEIGSMLSKASVDRHRAEQEFLRELATVEQNAVEEFQLAITRQSSRAKSQVHSSAFVDHERIEALRVSTTLEWDFSRLIALCEELNSCWLYGSHHAVAMLSRAVIDHVPPLFGQKTFLEVANNYGSRSFKATMKGLEAVTRSIADGHLHTPIRQREALPNATQVDCRSALDALLAEIIRITP